MRVESCRLDAVQHFSQRFTNEWIAMLEKDFGKDSLFLVGYVERPCEILGSCAHV